MPKSAYVSIALVGGGADPLIEINGKRIGEKAPIDLYPIPAGVPVTIRAVNGFTGGQATQTHQSTINNQSTNTQATDKLINQAT